MGHSSAKKCILLTGANSGIGLAVAESLYKQNRTVILTCRLHALDQVKKNFPERDNCRVAVLEVSDDAQRRDVIEQAKKEFGGIDILVNCAGISYRSAVEDMSEADELLQFSTNYFGPMALIRGVLPLMREKGDGRIINVSSVGGMMAMPTMGAYSASKFALEGASEALWYEVKPWGIKVSLVQPGFVNSASFRNVRYSSAVQASGSEASAYCKAYQNMSLFIEYCMTRAWATPESVAARIVKLIDQPNPPLRVPATIDAHLFGLLRRIVPRRLYHALLYNSLPQVSTWKQTKKDNHS